MHNIVVVIEDVVLELILPKMAMDPIDGTGLLLVKRQPRRRCATVHCSVAMIPDLLSRPGTCGFECLVVVLFVA